MNHTCPVFNHHLHLVFKVNARVTPSPRSEVLFSAVAWHGILQKAVSIMKMLFIIMVSVFMCVRKCLQGEQVWNCLQHMFYCVPWQGQWKQRSTGCSYAFSSRLFPCSFHSCCSGPTLFRPMPHTHKEILGACYVCKCIKKVNPTALKRKSNCLIKPWHL